MHVSFDPFADAAYITFDDGATIDTTVELQVAGVAAIIVADLADGKIVGLEVLGATSTLPAGLLEQAADVDHTWERDR